MECFQGGVRGGILEENAVMDAYVLIKLTVVPHFGLKSKDRWGIHITVIQRGPYISI